MDYLSLCEGIDMSNVQMTKMRNAIVISMAFFIFYLATNEFGEGGLFGAVRFFCSMFALSGLFFYLGYNCLEESLPSLVRKYICLGVFSKIIVLVCYLIVGEKLTKKDILLFTNKDFSWLFFCLAIWSAMVWLLKRINLKLVLVIAVAFGCLIGFVNNSTDYFLLGRLFTFFPYFLIGFALSKLPEHDELKWSKQKRVLSFIVSFALILAWGIVSLFKHEQFSMLKKMAMGYVSYGKAEEVFLRLFVYAVSLILVMSLLFLLTFVKKICFTSVGERIWRGYIGYVIYGIYAKKAGLYDYFVGESRVKCLIWALSAVCISLLVSLIPLKMNNIWDSNIKKGADNFNEWLKAMCPKEKLLFSLPITVLAVLIFGFYGPLGMYLSNTTNFFFDVKEILKVTGFFSLVALVCVMIISIFLSYDKNIKIFSIILGIAIGWYVQGAINIQYGNGLLDGTKVIWSEYIGYAIIDSVVWCFCLALPFLVFRFAKNYSKQILIGIALFFTLIQLPAMLVQLLNYRPTSSMDLLVTKNGMFELGKESNEIVFILDTMDDAYFSSFIEDNPEYKDVLSGFVHYDNVLASGARTIIGMPTMLSGVPYRSEVEYSDYIDKVWSQDNVISEVHDAGINVGIYSGTSYFSGRMMDYVDNFKSTGEDKNISSYGVFATKLYKLTSYIYMPHILKPIFYFDTAEFNSAKDNSMNYVFDDSLFGDDFEAHDSSFGISNNYDRALRIYHLDGAHKDYTLDCYGNRQELTSRKEQVKGVFYILENMLNSLKEQDLYNNATIIITADHGDKGLRHHSTLLIKEKNAEYPYTESSIPISMYDLPGIISTGLDLDILPSEYGVPIEELKEDDKRERHFIYNNQKAGAQMVIEEYFTTDNLNENSSLTLYKSYDSIESNKSAYEFGTSLSFELEGTANKYCTEGVGATSGFNTLCYGPVARIELPIEEIPVDKELFFKFQLGSKWHLKQDYIQVYVNDVLCFEDKTGTYRDNEFLTFNANADDLFIDDSNKSVCIEFVFPNVASEELDVELASRTLTIAFKSMNISAK